MNKSRYIIKFIFCLTILLLCFNVAADELKEGIWEGNFTNHLGKRYKIKYNVNSTLEDEKQVLQIEMINLDLEPKPDYTYQLIDITRQDDNLEFKIPRKHDTKLCTLSKQEESKYRGQCFSDKAKNGETSQISMTLSLTEVDDTTVEGEKEELPLSKTTK